MSTIERIRSSFARQGLMQHLGATLTRIEPGAVSVHLASRAELSQQHGYIHAGAVSAIADTAGCYAALTLMDENSEVLTVEYKINLLAPAQGDYLEAEGTVLRSGRTLTVCRHRLGDRRRPASRHRRRTTDTHPSETGRLIERRNAQAVPA